MPHITMLLLKSFLLSIFICSIKTQKSSKVQNQPHKMSSITSEMIKMLKHFEISTSIEGDIDPDDKIKVTTRVVNNDTGEVIYLNPTLDNIKGKFQYIQSFSNEIIDGKSVLKGHVDSNVEGSGKIGVHVQHFSADDEDVNINLFKKYSKYLKMYIDYLYKYNLDLDPTYIKNIKDNFMYYGSLANGENPSLQTKLKLTNLGNKIVKQFETIGGSRGEDEDSSISYAISNYNSDVDKTLNFQNMISSSLGDSPVTGLKIDSENINGQFESSMIGQSIVKPTDGFSISSIDSTGSTEGFGQSLNSTYSEQDPNLLATVSSLNNQSLNQNEDSQSTNQSSEHQKLIDSVSDELIGNMEKIGNYNSNMDQIQVKGETLKSKSSKIYKKGTISIGNSKFFL